MEFKEFDFQECPTKFDRATYQDGKWKKDDFNLGGRFRLEEDDSIPLYLTSYNGEVYETPEEWFVNIPLTALSRATPGTWLVPINQEGSYTFCFNKNEAIHAVLIIAKKIWNTSHKLPTIEAIRLDACDGEKQDLRIYQFWFAETTLPPHISAFKLVDLK